MTEQSDHRHIGFDPSKWINRLMDVNESSQFTPEDRAIIAAGLMRILQHLSRDHGRALLSDECEADYE